MQCEDIRLTAFELVGAQYTRAKSMEASSRQVRPTSHMLSRRGVIEAHRGAVDHLVSINNIFVRGEITTVRDFFLYSEKLVMSRKT